MDVLTFVSQPLDRSPSQLPKPVVHVAPQTPATHEAVALAGVGQALPQRPQCAGLVLSATSQPSEPSMLQSPKPALHVNPQVLATHVRVEFATVGHGREQPPQCSGLLLKSTSQPFVATASQLPKPMLHVNEQTLALHVATALGAGGHTRPQAPQ
jgi:hypothetical protein